MITRISIENFKGIGEKIEIPIRPLTFLFGPNSGGKSSVLHALHYLREVLVHRHLEIDTTEAGGDLVSLGGFLNFVHNRAPDQNVTISVELDCKDIKLADYLEDHPDRTLGWKENENLSERLKTCQISLCVAWSQVDRQPIASSWSVEVNEEMLATIEHSPGTPNAMLTNIHFDHPIWLIDFEDDEGNIVKKSMLRRSYCLAVEKEEDFDTKDDTEDLRIPLINLRNALPIWGEPLQPALNDEEKEKLEQSITSAKTLDNKQEEANRRQKEEREIEERIRAGWAADFTSLISQFMVSLGEMLADRLRNVRYLGPLRDVPGRRYDVPKYIEPNRWANGMAAWDRLAESTDEFVEQCGHWLESLGSGYQLQRRRFFEIAEDDPFLWMLTSGKAHEVMESDEIRRQMDQYPVQAEIRLVDINTGQLLSPQDVGVGISQVVPVIVSACDDHGGMTAIEQPELHLHPAMQVSLGDLFLLKSLHTFKEPLIIETHSEHLLLRVLRRIREQHEKENISPIWQDLEIHPDNICVVYVWQKNGSTNAQRLKITDEGEFMDKWPNGFFEERAEELF